MLTVKIKVTKNVIGITTQLTFYKRNGIQVNIRIQLHNQSAIDARGVCRLVYIQAYTTHPSETRRLEV